MNVQPKLSVVFFRTDSGNEPVRAWLEGLGGEDERRIDADIVVVAEHWPIVLRTSLVKKLRGEGNLWEIRSRISNGKRIARVLFTVEAGELILLHGLLSNPKNTQEDLLWHEAK